MKVTLEIEASSQEAFEKLNEIEGIRVISTTNNIPEQVQKIIDGIIEDFDFDKVHDIMEYLDWTWCGDKLAPTIEQLKDCAENLLKSVYNRYFEVGNGEQLFSASGGFEATYLYDVEDCFELRFVLESVNNYY